MNGKLGKLINSIKTFKDYYIMKTVRLSKFDKLYADIKAKLMMEAIEDGEKDFEDKIKQTIETVLQNPPENLDLERWTVDDIYEQFENDLPSDEMKANGVGDVSFLDGLKGMDDDELADAITAQIQRYADTDSDIKNNPEEYGLNKGEPLPEF